MARVPQTVASALVVLLLIREDKTYDDSAAVKHFWLAANEGTQLILSSAAFKVCMPEETDKNLLTMSWAVVAVCDLKVTTISVDVTDKPKIQHGLR